MGRVIIKNPIPPYEKLNASPYYSHRDSSRDWFAIKINVNNPEGSTFNKSILLKLTHFEVSLLIKYILMWCQDYDVDLPQNIKLEVRE